MSFSGAAAHWVACIDRFARVVGSMAAMFRSVEFGPLAVHAGLLLTVTRCFSSLQFCSLQLHMFGKLSTVYDKKQDSLGSISVVEHPVQLQESRNSSSFK